MRFWLAAFVVLFAAIELLDWIAQIGSWQPSGVWLVLGGMGLAALSNLNKFADSSDATVEEASSSANEKVKSSEVGQAIAATTQQKAAPAQNKVDQNDKDSISFKVRPLKR